MQKGFTFSIIMVLAALTIVQVVLMQRGILSQKRQEYFVKNRISDMNDLYDNIILDSEKSIDIIAKRAISITTSHIIQDGTPVSNADMILEELMMDGTFNGSEELLMESASIPDWTKNMTDIANLKGYSLNLTFTNLDVKPYDSINLVVESDLFVNITDNNGVASIARDTHITKTVSVEGFEDPLYPLNTNGMVTQKIYETPYPGNFTELLTSGSGDNGWTRGMTFVVEGDVSPVIDCPNKSSTILVIDNPTLVETSVVNSYMGLISDSEPTNTTTIPYVYGIANVTSVIPNTTYILVDGDNSNVWFIENFVTHDNGSYYYTSESGPSFLDRLEGKMYIQTKYSSQSTNSIGMESFVNKTNLISHKLSVDTSKTNVDYLYFSNSSYPGSSVKGVDSYFRIDSNHTDAYGVSGILGS